MGATEQQAVVVFLKLSDDEFGSFEEREFIFDLEERIRTAVQQEGEYDGHEFGGGWAKLYLYGPDCRQLSARIVPLLRDFRPLPGSYVIQRPGAPGTVESTLRV